MKKFWTITGIILFIALVVGIIIFLKKKKKKNVSADTHTTPVYKPPFNLTEKIAQVVDTIKGEKNVYANDNTSPLTPTTFFSSYGVGKYNITVPAYPMGALMDEQGASNYYKIQDKDGNIGYVLKDSVTLK